MKWCSCKKGNRSEAGARSLSRKYWKGFMFSSEMKKWMFIKSFCDHQENLSGDTNLSR